MDLDLSYAPLATWPADHRAAVVVLVHVDAPDTGAGETGDRIGMDYTASGLQRLIAARADLDIPMTTAWTARALERFPQLARAAAESGLELALSVSGQDLAQPSLAALDHISDAQRRGYVENLPLPGRAGPVGNAPTVSPAGAAWVVTGTGGDVPILTPATGDDGTVVVPVSPYWIDTTWLAPDRPLPPSSLLEAWSLSLGAVRAEGGLMTIVLHPHISGRPGISTQVVRFLDEVIDSGDTWVASAGQVAEWWSRERDDE